MKKKYYKYIITLGHACNDINSGSLGSIIPFLIAAYNYNYQTAATLVFLSNLIGSIVQPIFGDLADKKNIPWSMTCGMLLTAVSMGLMGFFKSFTAMAILVTLSGVGSAIFHPQAARLINRISEEGHQGDAISIFSFGGSFGYAFGPVVVTAAITSMGLKGTGVLIIPALVASGLLFSQSRNFTDEGLKEMEAREKASKAITTDETKDQSLKAGTGETIARGTDGNDESGLKECKEVVSSTISDKLGPHTEPRDQWGPFILLGFFVFGRSVINTGLNTFLSLFFINELGRTEVFGNTMLSLFYVVSLLTTLVGGKIADRFGYIKMIRISFVVCVACLLVFSLSRNLTICMLMMIPISAGANLSYSPIVVLGQKYLPNHIGLASGLTLGLAMSFGGLMSPLLGRIADANGLGTAMLVMCAFGGMSIIFAMLLKKPRE